MQPLNSSRIWSAWAHINLALCKHISSVATLHDPERVWAGGFLRTDVVYRFVSKLNILSAFPEADLHFSYPLKGLISEVNLMFLNKHTDTRI